MAPGSLAPIATARNGLPPRHRDGVLKDIENPPRYRDFIGRKKPTVSAPASIKTTVPAQTPSSTYPAENMIDDKLNNIVKLPAEEKFVDILTQQKGYKSIDPYREPLE